MRTATVFRGLLVSPTFASEKARALAEEFALDHSTIEATGKTGITLDDVRRACPPGPPPTLGDAGRRLWADIRLEWDLRPDEERMLLAACSTADELERMEGALAEADPVVRGSKGQDRAHPLIAEVRAHRLALRAFLDAIGIADDPSSRDDAAQRSHAGRQLARQRWSRRG